VGWYLAHDPTPLPHLFRVLWCFWFLRDHMGEVRAWVEQLLPAADSLDPKAHAELAWTALVAAFEVGDDPAALSARQRLAPLLTGIDDPFLHAVSQLAMAWSSPLVGDVDGAPRAASLSLEQLRGRDEPFWTALAVGSLASAEAAVGHDDDALRHLGEARDLAERFDNAWLAAWSRVQLGTLAVAPGRLEEARALLGEALDLSLAARSTNSVTLCLVGFARLAFVEGHPERAALLAGAAEGLRRRAGLRVWPLLRRGEAELVAQVRQALGADRFGEVIAGGARLTQRRRWPPSATGAAPAAGRPEVSGLARGTNATTREEARWRSPRSTASPCTSRAGQRGTRPGLARRGRGPSRDGRQPGAGVRRPARAIANRRPGQVAGLAVVCSLGGGQAREDEGRPEHVVLHASGGLNGILDPAMDAELRGYLIVRTPETCGASRSP
jgi:hypothetical protein